MNIEYIKEARAELAGLLDCFDKIISYYEGAQAAVIASFGPVVTKAEPVEQRPEKPGPKREVVQAARGGQSELRARLMEWIGTREGSFTSADLPESLRSDPKAAKALSNMANSGQIQRVGFGRYQRKGEEREEKTPMPAPAAEPARVGVPVAIANSKKPVERVAEAARHIIGLHGGKSCSAATLVQEARGVFPDLLEGSNGETNFRVRLIDAASAGLLVRLGKGPDAVYTTPPKQA
jgi:hypothetical protein